MLNMSKLGNSVIWPLTLPVPIVLTLGVLAAWILVPQFVSQNASDQAVSAATQIVNQFKIIRGYYRPRPPRRSDAASATLLADSARRTSRTDSRSAENRTTRAR